MGNSFLGGSLINSGGSRWKHHRKLFNPSYSQHMLDRYQPAFNHQAKELVKSIEPLAGKGETSIWVKASDVTLNTVCTTVLGISKASESLVTEDYKAALRRIFGMFSQRIAKVILHSDVVFKFSPLKRTQDDVIRTILQQSSKIVAQRKKERVVDKENGIIRSPEAHRSESFLDLLLNFAEDDLFNDREVQDELNTIIATGYDTLSTVIPYTLMLIGTFPEVQEKLYEEIISVVGHKDDVNKYHELPYLDAVFKESVRLFPPVPIVSRDCNEELQLKNYKLPAGCHCTIGIWAILRLPIWGPDAEQFRPERWLEPDSLPKSPGAYCSFSLGKRNCIGKFYSTMFTKTVLVHVIRRFRITSNIYELKFKYEIHMKPTEADRLSLELR
ncbi:cytochrome P450 4c21-like [Choristoneura fumiferana]|uniref:cytochrome P450 4c21-like n=1 Tax=Choristoneura fumiferana TaxID=7141 RepID=UPI003D15D38C